MSENETMRKKHEHMKLETNGMAKR